MEYTTEGTKVKCTHETDNGYTLNTYFECGSELYAKLLTRSLRENGYNKTKAFAEKHYEQGWNDKQKRKKKQEWFPSKM